MNNKRKKKILLGSGMEGATISRLDAYFQRKRS
jgi:hypothetical protein